MNIDRHKEAFCHQSYAHENDCTSYDRLELLGDSILNAAIVSLLYRDMEGDSGDLSIKAAELYSNKKLTEIGKRFGIDKLILTGKGQEVNDKIIADCVEALIGSVYLDDGFEIAMELVERMYKNDIDALQDRKELV